MIRFFFNQQKHFDSPAIIFRCRRKFAAAIFAFLAVFIFANAGFAQEDDETDDPVAIFNQAQNAHEKGDLATAIKLYEQAIKLAPEFPEAEFQRGGALLSLGKIDEAEKAFRRAIELREDWTLPMVSLGNLLIQKKEFAEAEKILTKAIQLNRENSPALVALAELRLQTNAAPEILREMLAKFQILTAKANPTAAVWAAQGAIEYALNDKAAAKKSLNNALVIDPKNIFARQTRINLALSESDFALALDNAQSLLQTAPNSTSAKILLARVYAADGKTADALKILDALDAKDKDVIELKNAIAASDSSNAAELEKTLETDPKNPAILGRLCTLLRLDDPAKAIEYCRRANEIEPANVNHAVGYGAALVQAKQYDAAITIFRRILQIVPDNQTAHANLAVALFQTKKFAEAKTEYRWLTENNPKNAIAYFFLAVAHDNLKEYVDAMANYQQFLRIADKDVNQLEIEKVNLRLPILQKQIKK